jgi:hypothetical protein
MFLDCHIILIVTFVAIQMSNCALFNQTYEAHILKVYSLNISFKYPYNWFLILLSEA